MNGIIVLRTFHIRSLLLSFKEAVTGYDSEDVGVANKGAIDGLTYIQNMIKAGALAKDISEDAVRKDFSEGRVACVIAGPWDWGRYEKAGIKVSVNLLPKLGGKHLKPFVGVLSAYFNVHSPNKKLAKDFMENYFLTDKGLAEVNNDTLLGVAALKSYEQILEADPVLQEKMSSTRKNAENGDLMPNISEMGRFWSAFQVAARSIGSDKVKPEDALKRAERRILEQQSKE